MRLPEELEPVRLLPEGAAAYLRINPVRIEELLRPIIEANGISQSNDLLQRTDSMVLAVMPFTGAAGETPARPTVYAVASGRFPTRSIALKLNTDRRWAREESGWVNKEDGLRIALGSRGQIILGTATLERIQSADRDRPHPVPELWSTAWDNDLAVYLPDPLAFLGGSLPLDPGGLPLESMLVSVRRDEGRYDVYMGFEFATERSALVFAPLCRLFLYALVRSLWPDQTADLLASVAWTAQGAAVTATGLFLDTSQLGSLLSLPFGESAGIQGGSTGGSR
jgi:hypothetical protein